MDLLKCFIKVKKGRVSITKNENNLILNNETNKRSFIVFGTPFFSDGFDIKFDIDYNIKNGEGIQIKILDKKLRVVENITDSSVSYYNRINRFMFFGISIEPKTCVELKRFEIVKEMKNDKLAESFKGNILLLTPDYPSISNKYNCAFVHTRVKEYKKLNYNVDVAKVNDHFINKTIFYDFEGVPVVCTGYNEIRNILQVKKYDKILIHFFDEKYAQILDATNLLDTKIVIYSHGSDTLYRAWDRLNAKYFETRPAIPKKIKELFPIKDDILNRYNEMPNVKFVFVSNWAKNLSEKLNNIKYKNCEIIPCFIDDNLYKYERKDPELRKKIFILRKFDDLNSYSIDINVRVILELSTREFFNDLEFSIYGDGELHYKLLEPLRKFPNVHIHKRFLSHDEIAKIHQENGIALFASRFDTQAVSACEAAMSGNVVITSKNIGTEEYIDPEIGNYCDTENFVQYADLIEKLYYDSDLFLKMSRKMHDSVMKTCSYDYSIKKDVELIKKLDSIEKLSFNYKKQETNPILTIAVPSYNVDKYLIKGIHSLIDTELSNKVEILIINDGSKDNTAKIAKELEKLTTVGKKSIVKLIDKENGGHGSTINKGIELATGKYFRLMDGDDYFITSEFEKFIQLLEKEDSDIVLTNYIEDFAIDAIKRPVHLYDFMTPYVKYNLNQMYYDGYGFSKWGPLLSTSTYKTSILKNANFKIDEKCFYVDMEYNFIGYVNSQTVVYYPLDIYNYYLGRLGQSISKESYMKNCYNHEKVCLRLVSEYEKIQDNLSEGKKNYLVNNIIIPMCKAQYDITVGYFNTRERFLSYDSKLKEYPKFYKMHEIGGKRIKLHRLTKGYLIRFDSLILKLINMLKRR